MSTLLLQFIGPMQSWGSQSRFSNRDTGLEPTKSGVIGLLCAALGRPRDADLSDLAALPMGVRVDREGTMRSDYHTAGAGYGVARPDGSLQRAVLSTRYYLADAVFLVGLEGERALLEGLQFALQRPRWQLFLGRKAFVPGAPVHLPNGLRDESLGEALTTYRWLGHAASWERPEALRLVIDTDITLPVGLADTSTLDVIETRLDIPRSFAERRFAARSVRTLSIPMPAKPEASEATA